MRLKRICYWFDSCLILVGRCLTCISARAHLLPHSLFLLPLHKNTHYNRDNTIYSKNTRYIINLSKISQSTSGAIKNHIGVKNLQSGGNPRKTFSTGYEPKELATVSRISRITYPFLLHDAQKEFGERDHRVPITEVKKYHLCSSLLNNSLWEALEMKAHPEKSMNVRCKGN